MLVLRHREEQLLDAAIAPIAGREACGDGIDVSDGDGGKDGRMGLRADFVAVSEDEGGVDDAGDAAAPAAAIGPGPGDAILVTPDKKKKKKRGSRGGQLQRLTLDQR